MSRHNLLILGTATLLAFASASAMAGPGNGFGGFSARGECTGLGMGDGAPGGVGLLGRAWRQLDLTQAQRDAIRAVVEAEREKVTALRQQLRQNREAFRTANPPTRFDEAAVRAHVAEQAKIRAELAVVLARTRAKALAVLNPEQLKQLEQWRDRVQERRPWGSGKRGMRSGGCI